MFSQKNLLFALEKSWLNIEKCIMIKIWNSTYWTKKVLFIFIFLSWNHKIVFKWLRYNPGVLTQHFKCYRATLATPGHVPRDTLVAALILLSDAPDPQVPPGIDPHPAIVQLKHVPLLLPTYHRFRPSLWWGAHQCYWATHHRLHRGVRMGHVTNVVHHVTTSAAAATLVPKEVVRWKVIVQIWKKETESKS